MYLSVRRHDANNLIVPLSSSDYANYANIRGGLAIPQGQLLPVQPKSLSVTYGFHPKFVEIQSMFNQNQVALLANVGTLVQPTTRDQYLQGLATVPQNLYSHADQQQQMQTATLNTFAEVAGVESWRQDAIDLWWKLSRPDFTRGQQRFRRRIGGEGDRIER